MTELITAAVSDFVRVIVTAVVLGAEDFAHFCGRDFTGEVALGRVPRKGIGCARWGVRYIAFVPWTV